MTISRTYLTLIAGLAVAGLGITPALAQMNKGMPASSMSHSDTAKPAQRAAPSHKRGTHKHGAHKHMKQRATPAVKAH